jgi:trimethylamine:corrinoid methyltransferase-like protein
LRFILRHRADRRKQRYRITFYEPLVSDWSNFGQWSEAGAKTATERAHAIWKRTLAEFESPPVDASVAGARHLRVVGTANPCPKRNTAGEVSRRPCAWSLF